MIEKEWGSLCEHVLNGKDSALERSERRELSVFDMHKRVFFFSLSHFLGMLEQKRRLKPLKLVIHMIHPKQKRSKTFVLLLFAVWTRLELATSAVTGRHSNQLNYQTSSLSFNSTKVIAFSELTNIFSKQISAVSQI